MQPLDVEDVHRGRESETTSSEHYATKDVEANPNPPRELIAQVGGCAKTFHEAQGSAVKADCHDGEEDQFPESDSEFHWRPPFGVDPGVCGCSASATSSRRWVIHQMPPSIMPPSGTKSGMRESTR